MTEDRNLAIDEQNRLARHEAVKDNVRREAQAEIENNASRVPQDEQAGASTLGRQLRQNAVSEVADMESELQRARAMARISQFMDYFFYLVYGIISLQILLDLLGARRGNGFRALVDTISAPFLAPFHGLIPDIIGGRFQLRLSYFVALAVYVLIHLAINGFLKLFAHRKTAI